MAIEGGYGNAAQFNQMANAAQQATVHVGKLVQQLALVQATTATVSFTVRSFSQLELVLTQTQAVAEGTAKEFKQMENAVRNYALATRFSAAESTLALYNLASAGLTIQQSLKAMGATLDLAQATMSDVGMAADTLASSLASFSLSADQASRVSNLFVASINKSQASIEKIAFSMRQVAPVARAMNNSIEETVAALSILYNQGLRGEQAGTALRNTMVRLANPTDKAKEALYAMGVATQTADGKVRKLKDVLADLSQVQGGVGPSTSTLKNIVDDEALPGALGLIRSADRSVYLKKLQDDKDFAEYAETVMKRTGKTARDAANELDLMERALTGTNAASETSMKMMLTLSGSFSQANNAVTELAITLGETVAPAMRSIATTVSDMGVAFRGLSDSQKQTIVTLPLLAAGAYATVKAFQALAGPVAMLAGLGKGAASGPNAIGTFGALGALFGGLGANASATFGNNPRGAAGAMGTMAWDGALGRNRDPDGRGRMMGATASRGDPATAFLLSQGMTQGLDSSKFASGALGLLGKTVGVLGGIAGTVMVLYEIYQLLDKLNVFGGNRSAKSEIGDVNIGDEYRRRGQSALLTNADPYEREQAIIKLRKELDDMVASQMNQWSTAVSSKLTPSREIDAIAKRMGGSTGNLDYEKFASIFMKEGGKPLDLNNKTVAGQVRQQAGDAFGLSFGGRMNMTDADLKQLQEIAQRWSQANADMKQIDKNIKDVGTAREKLDQEAARARGEKGYQMGRSKANIAAEQKAAQEVAGFMYVSRTFTDTLKSQVRAADQALAKARAEIANDPIAQFIANVSESREQQVRQALDQAQNTAKALISEFGQQIGGIPYISEILSGQDYMERIAGKGEDGKTYFKTSQNLQKGIISMLQEGGYSKEAMLKSFDDAVTAAIADLEGANPQLKANLEEVAKKTRSVISSAIDQQAIRNIQEMRNFRENVENRRTYIVGLRDRLVGGQLDALKEAVKLAAASDPFANSRLDVLEAIRGNNQSQQTLREIQNSFYKQFAPDGPGTNASADAEFAKFRRAFENNMNVMFRTNIQNIIATAKEARAKALAELRTNAADIKAQNLELTREMYLYTANPDYLDGAAKADMARYDADTEGKLEKIRERIRLLRQSIQANRNMAGMGLQALPDLQVPAIQTDQATQTHRTNVETKLDQIRDAINQSKIIGGATGAGSVPQFAQAHGNGVSLGYGGMGNSTGVGRLAGLNATFAENLQKFMEAVPGLAITGGFRTYEQQARLYAEKGPGWAARPGTSNHEDKTGQGGMAADLNYKGSSQLPRWVQEMGAQFGIHFPLADRARNKEPWHAESINKDVSGGTYATPRTKEATEDQKRLNDEMKRYSDIKMENISSEAQLKSALEARKVPQEDINRILELYKASSGEIVSKQQAEVTELEEVARKTQLVNDARRALLNTPAGQATSRWNEESRALDNMWQMTQRGASAADGVRYAFKRMSLDVQSDGQIAAQAFTSFTGGIADVLAGVITGTEKDWKQAAANMLRSIAQVILKALIMRALVGIGGWFGMGSSEGNGFLGGNLLSAKGNAFVGGGVTQFRNGGLVHSMQKFQMANGGIASMSEIGTEAILPLMRGKGGKLGVALYPNGYEQDGGRQAQIPINSRGRSGGGGNVALAFSPSYHFEGGVPGQQQGQEMDKDQVRRLQQDLDRETKATVMRVLNDQSRAGGALHAPTRKYNQGSSF